ncbi:tail fiber protein [Sphingomonas sp. NIBR02145]|uniref:phage tail protein n=1 Tax=Sphingomonas sp. NIBR02145 TaxID=3014784 RepID=UPI0022B5CBEA|nr:tail fiber protein [Sphingomonas sp. NIBR02145]WHU00800.1 tail fiber protein [Sphingomonas sp. NIBR02145]
MKTVLLASAIAAIGFALPAHAQRDAIVGQVRLIGFDFCPEGWAEADGRLLPIQGNQALFALFSSSYGGNGSTNFALPDLRKAIPTPVTDKEKRLRYCVAIRGDFPRRP